MLCLALKNKHLKVPKEQKMKPKETIDYWIDLYWKEREKIELVEKNWHKRFKKKFREHK